MGSACLCMHAMEHVCIHVWRSEESLWELVLFFHHLGPRDGTRVIRLNKFLYLLSHLSSPRVAFLILNCLAIPETEEAIHKSGIHVYVCFNLLKVEFQMFLLFLIWLSQSSWLFVSHLNLHDSPPPLFTLKVNSSLNFSVPPVNPEPHSIPCYLFVHAS